MSLVLRPYQLDCIESLRQGFRSAHIRQVLCAATGSGKSIVAIDMVRSAIAKGSKVLFIVDRRILVNQFSAHLEAHDIEHGVFMAGHFRWRPEAQVQVCSVQTLEKMESWPAFDIIFCDEVHAMLRKSFINILERFPEKKVVGMTATPFHPMLGKHFSNVVNVITMRELVDQGFLVPFRVFVAHEIDTKGVPIVAGEWKKDELEERGRQIVGDVVADYLRLSQEIFGGFRKTICFSCGVTHGTELAVKFNEAGVRAVQISYKDSDEFKAGVLEEFAKPDSAYQMVISSDILTRGFDNTMVEHVILAHPFKKSFSMHVQTMGRAARIHPDKEFALVQDHAGNFLRFRDDWETLYHEGVQGLKESPDAKKRKELTEKQKEAAKCPRCKAVWQGKGDVCLHCGFTFERQNMVTAHPGQMLELTPSPKAKAREYSAQEKQDWYSQLLHIEFTRGKKKYYAYAAFIDKFGHKPHGYRQTMKPVGDEVKNWITHRNIKFYRGQTKHEHRA